MTSKLRKASHPSRYYSTPSLRAQTESEPSFSRWPSMHFPKFLARLKSSKSDVTASLSALTDSELKAFQGPAYSSQPSPQPTHQPSGDILTATSNPVDPLQDFHSLKATTGRQSPSRRSHDTILSLSGPSAHENYQRHRLKPQTQVVYPAKAEKEYIPYEDLHILSCYFDVSDATSPPDTTRCENIEEDCSQGFQSRSCGHLSSIGEETFKVFAAPTQNSIHGSGEDLEKTEILENGRSGRADKLRHYQLIRQRRTSGKRRQNEVQIIDAYLCYSSKPKIVSVSQNSRGFSSNQDGVPANGWLEPNIGYPMEASKPSGPAQMDYESKSRSSSGEISLSASRSSSEDSSSAYTSPSPFSISSARESVTTVAAETSFPIQLQTDKDDETSQYSQDDGFCQSHQLSYSSASQQPDSCGDFSNSETISTHSNPSDRIGDILDLITRAIEASGEIVLSLDSPTMDQIRSSHSSDILHIQALQKIFPTASATLLSSLAAWILIDLYLSRVFYEIDHLRDQSLAQVYSVDNEDHCSPITTKCNEALYHIPQEIRRILSIESPGPAVSKIKYSTLVERVAILHQRVAMIEVALIEMVKGTCDEDLWIAVRCLVEVIEDRNKSVQ